MAISKNDLKEFSSLKRKSKRLELGLFLVEGIKNCEELLASDYEVVAVLTTNNISHEFPNAIDISSKDAARISQLKSPSPVMAIAKIPKNESFLKDCIKELKESNIRTSIFVDPNLKVIDGAKKIGSDRIELYTKSYADNFNIDLSDAILPYLKSSKHAQNINIEINAGHDLNLKNIEFFSKSIINLKEVSIGHALICESLYFGIENTVKKYISILK